MTDLITSCSDPRIPVAIDAQWANYTRNWERTGHAIFLQVPGMTLFTTPINHPQTNGVITANLEKEKVVDAISKAKDYFSSLEKPWTWYTGPITRPVDIGKYLVKEGLKKSHDMLGMAVGLDTLNGSGRYPKEFAVKKVDSPETLKDFVYVESLCFDTIKKASLNDYYTIEEAYGFSDKLPKQSFLGYLKGKPVASSTMVLGNGVVGVFNIGTIPKARKKGIGTLMTLIPLQEARAMGYKVGILHSPAKGSSMAQRIGFQEFCKISAYRPA